LDEKIEIHAGSNQGSTERRHHPCGHHNREKTAGDRRSRRRYALTGALVLVWMYLESNGDANIMQQFARSLSEKWH